MTLFDMTLCLKRERERERERERSLLSPCKYHSNRTAVVKLQYFLLQDIR